MTKVVIPDNSSQDVSAMTDFSRMEDAFAYSHGITKDEAATLRYTATGAYIQAYMHTYS